MPQGRDPGHQVLGELPGQLQDSLMRDVVCLCVHHDEGQRGACTRLEREGPGSEGYEHRIQLVRQAGNLVA